MMMPHAACRSYAADGGNLATWQLPVCRCNNNNNNRNNNNELCAFIFSTHLAVAIADRLYF